MDGQPAPLNRSEIVDLFWQSEAPKALGTFCSGYVVHYARFEPIPLLPEAQVMDVSKTLPSHEQITFYLDGRPFGEEIYLAVVCNGHIIVPPFPLAQRENLPNMRPPVETSFAA